MVAFHFIEEDTSSELPQLVRKAVVNAMAKRLGPKFAALKRTSPAKPTAAEETKAEESKRQTPRREEPRTEPPAAE